MAAGRDTVFFVSDAHFGLDADERIKVGLFAELTTEMRKRAADIFIVGDLFDFWIEYRTVVRADYFRILHELRGLAEAGAKVHYVTGNHDFAVGTFLENAAGLLVHRESVDVTLQGRKVHISHGHKIGRKNTTKFVGALLRNKLLQSLYRLIHPDLGVRIGAAVSAASKKKYRNTGMSPNDLNKYRNAAQAQLRNGENDLVIFAHTHQADLVNFDEGDYCNTGSWMDNYDYAVLRDGKITLMKWN